MNVGMITFANNQEEVNSLLMDDSIVIQVDHKENLCKTVEDLSTISPRDKVGSPAYSIGSSMDNDFKTLKEKPIA